MFATMIVTPSPRAEAQSDSANPGVAGLESEEVIDDPELAGKVAVDTTPTVSPATLRVELHTRTGVDTRWENDREEIVESTQIALFETTYQRSEDLGFAVGLRARHQYGRRPPLTRMRPWRKACTCAPAIRSSRSVASTSGRRRTS
jgi:hypothetical protein